MLKTYQGISSTHIIWNIETLIWTVSMSYGSWKMITPLREEPPSFIIFKIIGEAWKHFGKDIFMLT